MIMTWNEYLLHLIGTAQMLSLVFITVGAFTILIFVVYYITNRFLRWLND